MTDVSDIMLQWVSASPWGACASALWVGDGATVRGCGGGTTPPGLSAHCAPPFTIVSCSAAISFSKAAPGCCMCHLQGWSESHMAYVIALHIAAAPQLSGPDASRNRIKAGLQLKSEAQCHASTSAIRQPFATAHL